MRFAKRIVAKGLEGLAREATIGLEKEGQRILGDGTISQTPHPEAFGSRDFHPYIQTDFAESQVELISPVSASSQEALRFLNAIHEVTFKHLDDEEYLWPLSMPAILPKEEAILEAQMGEEDTAYRQYLTTKYGKYKQMVSGIHYNFGFSQAFLEALADEEDLIDLRNDLYMTLARQFLRYQWILIYLLGACPLAPEDYFSDGDVLTEPVRSIRTSPFGYVNDAHIEVSFETLETYVRDLETWVAKGDLIAEKEFYESVRFRGSGQVAGLLKKGIQYLEFRIFDLNPFAPYGITAEDARFIHLFILGLLWLEEVDEKTARQLGKSKKFATSLSHPLSPVLDLTEAQQVFAALEAMAEQLQLPSYDKDIIAAKKAQLSQPEETISGQLFKAYERTGNLLDLGLNLAKAHKAASLERPYGLQAFSKMELSTQALLVDLIRYGIEFDILDERDQFLKLNFQGQIEYLKNGNMTRHDTYISPLIMENKVVTKKVLAQAGFAVPASIQLTSLEEAREVFQRVKGKPIVIKPKSTNYGLGITIFEEGKFEEADFLKAIELALAEDLEVMVEDFMAGTEYRFFVLGGQTQAVLLRVPAHVIGDGQSSIVQLVAAKNADPLRGDGKSSPLKKIELGDLEILQLKAQGLNPNSILKEDQVAYLRANSNISTGGDSIDMTDQVHPSYKEVAVAITKAMQAEVCGVDLIIPDINQPVTAGPDSYGIIEANFNPMMMMHIYPAQGQGRPLTREVLKMLYPTYPW